MKKIHASIDKAIQGMLDGDWSRSTACRNTKGDDAPCMILEAPGMTFSDENHPKTDESESGTPF